MVEPAGLIERSRLRPAAAALWLYVAGLLATAGALHSTSDRWWIATLLMFAPRWVWGLPLGVFVPLVASDVRRLAWPFGLALAIVVGPIMGFCIPSRNPFDSGTPEPSVRVLSCNGDSRELDPVRFRSLLNEVRPSIVAMQDVWAPHVSELFSSTGWHVHTSAGMCLASRFPIRAVDVLDFSAFGPGLGWANCYALETPSGVVHFFNLHLATPRWGLLAAVSDRSDGAKQLQHNSDTRREQSAALSHRARLLAGPVLLAGDFNTPVESTIHRECWSDYQNAFSVAGFGCGSTHLTELTAVRIDHILATADWHIRKCWVGPDVGSAHRPIVADLTRRVGEPRGTAQLRARTSVERR